MAPAFLRAFVPSRPQMPLQFLLHPPPRHHLQHRLEHIPVHLRLNRVHILGIVVPGHRFALLSRLTSTITKMRANDGHFCQPLIYRNFYTLSGSVPNGTNLRRMILVPVGYFVELAAWFCEELVVFWPAFFCSGLDAVGSAVD